MTNLANPHPFVLSRDRVAPSGAYRGRVLKHGPPSANPSFDTPLRQAQQLLRTNGWGREAGARGAQLATAT